MPLIRVAVDVSGLIPSGSRITADAFPNLVHAINTIAQGAQAKWASYAQGEPLPDGRIIRSRSGAYLRSIKLEERGPFGRDVFSDAPHAQVIEEGHPAFDMKKALDSSLKVRTTRDGRRYLIIPFRWGTPGTVGFRSVMPHEDLHAAARNLAPSRVISMGERQSGTGAYDIKTRKRLTVPQRQYKWGGRLSAKAIADAGVFGKAAERMKGMVKFQHPTRPGSKDTQYLTFRTMMEGSDGWQMPARAGYYPARTVADEVRKIAERALPAAVRADVEAAMRGAP